MPVVAYRLADGEYVICKSGAMCWMSPIPCPLNTLVTDPGHTMPISGFAQLIACLTPGSIERSLPNEIERRISP